MEAEYQSLKHTLCQLLEHAEHNQSVMERCQERELQLLTAVDLVELIDRMTNGLMQSFELDQIHLSLFDPYNVIAELLHSLNKDPSKIPNFSLIADIDTAEQYADSKNIWLGSWRDSRPRLFQQHECGSVAILPLRQPDGLSGFIHMGSQNPERFDPSHATDFLSRLCSVAAVCLENAVNREKLRLIGLTDPLTGLYNRRHLNQRLSEEVARALRHQQALSCLFVDADHFKNINDTHGHAVGDQVLVAIAQRLKMQLRHSDLAARYGGEEFVVLLPQTDIRSAHLLGERIRLAICETPIPVGTGEHISLTTSVGVAQLDNALHVSLTASTENMLNTADHRVYKAKRTGRNCVVSA